MTGAHRAQLAASDSKKSYDLPTLTMLVIASMVGAGVFTTSGFTLGVVGSPARVMLCWCLGGVIAMCGAVAYGRLASLMPESGGEYLYLSRNVHPCAGFLAGWISLTAGFSGSIATAAVALEQYAIPDAATRGSLPPDLLAILVVIAGGTIHGLHVTAGKWMQNFVVVAKLATLIVFLAVVLFQWNDHQWHVTPMTAPRSDAWDSMVGVATSLVWISLSFAGFNAAIYVASESSDARINVRKALLYGTSLTTVLYLILNAIFVTSVPTEELMWKEPVAAIAAAAIGGSWLESVIRIAVSLGLLSSILGMMMAGPRVYSKMADDGVFPRMFRADNGGIARSISLQTAIAVGLILLQRLLMSAGLSTSSLLGLLFYLGTTLSLSSAFCVATLFLPGVRGAVAEKNSAIVDGAAAVYVTTTLMAVLLMFSSRDPEGNPQWGLHLAGVAITLVTGLVVWWWVNRRAVNS